VGILTELNWLRIESTGWIYKEGDGGSTFGVCEKKKFLNGWIPIVCTENLLYQGVSFILSLFIGFVVTEHLLHIG